MEEIKNKSHKFVVPAGKYFLGDPGYTMHGKFWGDVLDSCNYFAEPIGEVEGHKVLGFKTAYGDGTYWDNFVNKFGVDSGLIGLVPEALIKITGDEVPLELGVWVTFEYPTVCETNGTVLTFGQHRINTGDAEDDEDEEY